MLKNLGALAGALVVMDAGIATEANLNWLREHGYRYLVVSRERARQFEAETAIPIETAAGNTVHIQRVDDVGSLFGRRGDYLAYSLAIGYRF